MTGPGVTWATPLRQGILDASADKPAEEPTRVSLPLGEAPPKRYRSAAGSPQLIDQISKAAVMWRERAARTPLP